MQQISWYAAHTKPRNEKKSAGLLLNKGVEVFLPLQKTLKQWSDRKKWVEIPLINSYIFVKTDLSDYLEILNTPGIVRIIGFEGKPVPIPDKQIDTLKAIISENIEAEATTEFIPEGKKVEILYGSLKGLTGELISYRGKKKILIRLEIINTSVKLNIPANFVKEIR
ncbi:MAG: UpxY family transcription antiterminator [Bacteroidetes bacterium]|nr:UpxY family transcription antiterminator [Bacteroidota bacterium]